MTALEEQYFKDFEKKDYDAALNTLWEEHCAGHIGWPPTLEQVKKEMESRGEDPAPRR